MVIEICNEIWSISSEQGSSLILVKVVLFQSSGHGHPLDDARPKFFPDSKSPILGLSKNVSLISESFWEGGEKGQNV